MPGPPSPAVPALIGTGSPRRGRGDPRRPPAPGDGGPPTALAGAEALLARGAHQAVVGAPTAALSDLARAAALAAPSGRSVLLADAPAALGAVVALHCGELDVAESEMDRAIGSGLGGPVAVARHRLLQAWIAMQRGNTAQARTLAAAVPDPSGTTGRLEPRDELVAAALEVALARRSGDLAALLASWGRAREAVVRHPVDLYSLLPLGELLVGAARLRQEEWVAPYLADARALLARLGEPPLWAAPLHWAGLQAAIVTGSVAAAEQHAAALTATAGSGRYAAALAAGAAQWLQVLGGDVDAAAVETAARGLQAVGLGWEGSRLAGQAAIRTHHRGDMSALRRPGAQGGEQSQLGELVCAREDALDLGAAAGRPTGAAPGSAPRSTASRADRALSRSRRSVNCVFSTARSSSRPLRFTSSVAIRLGSAMPWRISVVASRAPRTARTARSAGPGLGVGAGPAGARTGAPTAAAVSSSSRGRRASAGSAGVVLAQRRGGLGDQPGHRDDDLAQPATCRRPGTGGDVPGRGHRVDRRRRSRRRATARRSSSRWRRAWRCCP